MYTLINVMTKTFTNKEGQQITFTLALLEQPTPKGVICTAGVLHTIEKVANDCEKLPIPGTKGMPYYNRYGKICGWSTAR